MFGIALAVVPVFARGDVHRKIKCTELLLSQIRAECPRANAIYAWHLPRAFSAVLDIEKKSGEVVKEFYPTVLFITKVKKLSRTRRIE